MSKTVNVAEKNRQKLKNKRKVLFGLFLNNPTFLGLAVEIKDLDDQLAEWTPTDALALSSDDGERVPERSPLSLTKVLNGRTAPNGRQHREQILTEASLGDQVRRSA